jgi:hypothetical protein
MDASSGVARDRTAEVCAGLDRVGCADAPHCARSYGHRLDDEGVLRYEYLDCVDASAGTCPRAGECVASPTTGDSYLVEGCPPASWSDAHGPECEALRAATSRIASDPGPPACEARLLPFRACVAAHDDGDDGLDAGAEDTPVAISGTVEAVSTGNGECQAFGIGPLEDTNAGWTFEIRGGSRSLALSLLLPWERPLFAIGDQLTLEHEGTETLGGSIDALTIRARDDSVLLFIGANVSWSQVLQPTDLSFRIGESTCDWVCGPASALEASAHGMTMVVAPGELAQVGDYVLHHGGYRQSVGCFDVGDHIGLAYVRGDLEALEAADHGADAGP